MIPEAPFFAQTTHQCGPAALAMALQWSGLDTTPAELIPQVYTPGRKGSLQSSLVAAARRHQRLGYVIQGRQCLLTEIAAGHPVIILQNLGLQWMPRWHYALVVGYDLPEQQIVLHSGRNANRRVGLKTFGRTWKRAAHWGLVVLPPGEMPVCSEEVAYLKAVLGLQQAGAISAAVTALESAALRWPQSVPTQMALGNAWYALGELAYAAQTFRRACAIDPDHGAAYNNLAHVLALMGNLATAETAARRAVELGGPLQVLYRKTLEEILQNRP